MYKVDNAPKGKQVVVGDPARLSALRNSQCNKRQGLEITQEVQ